MNNLPYDKNLVGKFIAIGAENIVYLYNDGKEVIKFPAFFSLRYIINPTRYCQELQAGLILLQKYLPENISPSKLFFFQLSRGKMKYIVIEPFISGHALCKIDLKNQSIKDQFLAIIKAKELLEEKEGIFLDLFGIWGLLFRGRLEISNILIEKESNRVLLIDIGTANLRDDRIIISAILKWAKRKQTKLLNYYLN